MLATDIEFMNALAGLLSGFLFLSMVIRSL